ncbi:hypothetical protein KFK09_020542 [Dendrobium nobile]|uniref:Uncharacterized protein n=1 Tax=Dendrobium nobile TaxID=94219 RepID=A0A8T3ALL0_DENNO|nr:hypothetical protein KFK09_020542 [Dendrobium nobile]
MKIFSLKIVSWKLGFFPKVEIFENAFTNIVFSNLRKVLCKGTYCLSQKF